MTPNEVQRVRVELEKTTDYDAVKAIANRSLNLLDDALTQLEAIRSARHSTGPYVRYEEDTLDRVLGIPRAALPGTDKEN